MKVSTRATALVFAIATAAGLAVPLAAPASAALKPSVSCSKLVSTTTIASGKGTVASSFLTCTPAALSLGGSSTVTTDASKLAGKITSKITWKGGKGTTTATETFAPQKGGTGKCPAGTKYLTKVTGTTQASTGAAAKVIKAGEPINGLICTKLVGAKFVSSLLAGTKFTM